MKFKVGKKLFIGALVVMFLQIAVAHRAIIQPFSMPQDPTLFYIILGISLILFPIVLAIIFSYLLDKVKWLDKKSFLGAFLVIAFIFVILFGSGYMDLSGWVNNTFFELRRDFRDLFIYTGFPISVPLIYILDWGHSESVFVMIYLTGMFVVSILFALIYSLLTRAAKKGFKWYRRVFVSVIVVLFLYSVLTNLYYSYLSHLNYHKKCLEGLNLFQCSDSEYLGGGYYYRYKDDVYAKNVFSPLHEKVEDFEIFEDGTFVYAKGKNGVYRMGHTLTSRVDDWEMLEGKFSKDDVNVYYLSTPLKDVDLESFVIFGEGYACDKNDVYFEDDVIYKADPYSFAMTGCTGLGFDYRDYYRYSSPISHYNFDLKEYEDKPCFDEVFATCIDALEGKEEDLYEGTTSMRNAESPNGKFFVSVDFPNVVLTDVETGEIAELMSVLDTTDGVDFFWSPNNQVIAMTVVNQQDETYTETYGTKMFLLEIDEDGNLMNKTSYSIRIRYECHDAGCNVSSEDFYFEDEEMIVYRTWESETPYEDAENDDMLRELNLTE